MASICHAVSWKGVKYAIILHDFMRSGRVAINKHKKFSDYERKLCGLCGNDVSVAHISKREDGVTCCNACWHGRKLRKQNAVCKN